MFNENNKDYGLAVEDTNRALETIEPRLFTVKDLIYNMLVGEEDKTEDKVNLAQSVKASITSAARKDGVNIIQMQNAHLTRNNALDMVNVLRLVDEISSVVRTVKSIGPQFTTKIIDIEKDQPKQIEEKAASDTSTIDLLRHSISEFEKESEESLPAVAEFLKDSYVHAAFMALGGSVSKTAEKLKVHVNTIRLSLKRLDNKEHV